MFLRGLQGPSEMMLLPHLPAEVSGLRADSILDHIFFMSHGETVAEEGGVKVPLAGGGFFSQPEHWVWFLPGLLSGNL